MNHLTMLLEASSVYERHESMDRQARIDAAVSLAEWGVFSARAISRLTGLPKPFAAEVIGKSDKSGGRFDPEILPIAVEIVQLRNRGEIDVFKSHELLQGTTSYFASRLTGIPRSNLARWSRQAESMMEVKSA